MSLCLHYFVFLTDWQASNSIWITSKIWDAGTNSSMIPRGAIRILSTPAGVHTFFQFTFQVGRTVWILQALVGITFDIRVSLMIWEA